MVLFPIPLYCFRSPKDFENRQAQRETWLFSSKFQYKFLPDSWSKNLKVELDEFNDILFLGETTGRGGARLYKWLQYAVENFSRSSLIGISNSDLYACSDLFSLLEKYDQQRVVIGWWHDKDQNWLDPRFPNSKQRPNEQFVVITWQLAAEILKLPICLPKEDGPKCNIDSGKYRVDTTHAGSSLGGWLGDIGNITGIRINDQMAHQTPFSKARYPNPIEGDFCRKMVSYHKATPDLMRHLYCFDEDISERKQFCETVERLKEFEIQL